MLRGMEDFFCVGFDAVSALSERRVSFFNPFISIEHLCPLLTPSGHSTGEYLR
jgi:hypothetical protein